MNPYNVLVTHVGHWWLIEVPDLEASTQSRRFAEVEHRSRRLIAETLDVPFSAVSLGNFHLELGGLDLDVAADDLESLSGLPPQRVPREAEAPTHAEAPSHR